MDAARDLFLGQGYAATTMPAIAEAAGVAVDTVYASVGPKPVLMRLLVESAISGEATPVAPDDRDYVREMIRYGVLPVDHDFNASVDPFELDKAYWKTFWHVPK